MQRIPSAGFGGKQRVEPVAARILEHLQREFGLGAARHLLDQHRRRAEPHRHRYARAIGHLTEFEQLDGAELLHRLARDDHAQIRIAAASRRHDRSAARDVLDRLDPQFPHVYPTILRTTRNAYSLKLPTAFARTRVALPGR